MCSALLLTSVMASGRGRGERLKRTTDTEIKLRRKKWAEDNPRIYLGFDIYGKWTAIKEKYNLKQDREVASMLIECWNQHKEKELEGRSVPGQSSTKAKHVHQITGSASSESCISGVEQLSREAELLSIYEHKAKATDKSFIEYTGELENFHQHILMYAAKRFSYSYPMYKARNYLAAIDYQQHKDRGQALDKAGNPRFHRLYSKRKNTWSAVPVKIEKEYKYMDNLLSGILDRIRNHQGPTPKIFPLSDDDPRKIKRNIAVVSPPPTKELVAIKKSRFG